MLATTLQALDNTIANVALPRMQGSLSASQEQTMWVLTSYIVAAAVMTPLSGWLAGRFGRRNLVLASVATFTVASMLCGLAQSVSQIVLFRFLQGASGAALVPMSQAVLFDINPPERHGKAMSIWGLGVVIGPMLGPIIGGWLTDNYSWRWVFYINLPLGVLAFMGVLAYLPDGSSRRSRFDFQGFALMVVAISALQLMLDRGPTLDWFGSTEICIEAVAAGLAFYLFVVHCATSEDPFIHPALFRDRNFLTGNIVIFAVGTLLFATMALLPSLLQTLMAYPATHAGWLTAPRSIGSLVAMLAVGSLLGRFDVRLIIGAGFLLTAASLWQMTQFSLLMDGRLLVWSGLMQGLGISIVYVPLATITFATLPHEFRNEAAAQFSLTRNIGSSVGISIVQALLTSNIQRMHSSLAAHITPYNLDARDPALATQLASHSAAVALNGEVTRQAGMIAYIDDFKLMMIVALLAIPLLLLVRVPKRRPSAAEEIPVVVE